MNPEANVFSDKKFNMWIWALIFLIGVALWIISFSFDESHRVWRALLINFSFFTPLAGGMMVWPAVVTASNGKWSESVDNIAFMGIGFSIPSILTLLVLWFGSSGWSPWAHKTFTQGFWLNNNFLFSRDLIALTAFWVLAMWYLVSGRKKNKLLPSGILILVYCIVFSIIGFDLIMGLDPEWKSKAFGAYFFITGFYAAVTAWTLLTILFSKPEKEMLHDLGKLIFAFSILTSYLMFSQLLPMWYENLIEETRFLVPRYNYLPWKGVSYFILAVVYLGPLVLLLTEWSKENYWYLGVISCLLLVGLWIERWWLVSAKFSKHSLNFGLPEISISIAFIGIFIFSVELAYKRIPTNISKHQEKN